MHKKYLESKQQYISLKKKYSNIVSIVGGNYSCSNKPTNIFQKFCNSNKQGRYKTIEECVFSEECMNLQKELHSRTIYKPETAPEQEYTHEYEYEHDHDHETEPHVFDIDRYKCILWHFFDGFIDSNIGSNTSKHIDTLKSIGLYNNEINIIESYPTAYNVYNNSEKIIEIFTDTCIMYDNAVKSDNNAIILICTPDHQMATLIINKNGKKYISIVNSGDGLNRHYNNNSMYNIWHTYELIPDKTYEILHRLALLMTFVQNINNFTELHRNSIIQHNRSYFNNFGNNTNSRENFMDLYKKIKLPSVLDSLKHIISNSLNIHDETLKLYYETFNILGKPLRPVGTVFNNASLIEFIQLWRRTVKLFPIHHPLRNRKFILTNGYILTDAQKSGSCSWFSLFWSIIGIKLIFDNPSNTIDYIKKLDSKFAEMLYWMISKDYFYYIRLISGDFYLLSDLARKIGFTKQKNGEIKRVISINHTLALLHPHSNIKYESNEFMINTLEFTRICANLAIKLRKGQVASIKDVIYEYKILIDIASNKIIDYDRYFSTLFLTLNLLYFIYVINKGYKLIEQRFTQKYFLLPQISSIVYLTKEELYMSCNILSEATHDINITHTNILKKLKEHKSYIFPFNKINIQNSLDPYDCYSNKIYYDLNTILFGNTDKPNIFYQLLRHNKEKSQKYIFNMIYSSVGNYSIFSIDFVASALNLLVPAVITRVNMSILTGLVKIVDSKNIFDNFKNFMSVDNIKKPSDLDDITKVDTLSVAQFQTTEYILKTMGLDRLGKFYYKESEFSIVKNDQNAINFDTIFGLPYKTLYGTQSETYPQYKHICKFVRDDNNVYLIVIDNPECSEEYTKYIKNTGDTEDTEDNIFLQKRLYIIEYSVATDKWTVNNQEALLNPEIKLFPFMIFAPKNITKLVYRSGNSWNMMCFASHADNSTHIFPNNAKFMLLDLKISQNMITPIFTTRSMKILQKMYKNYGGYVPALGLLDDTNTKSFGIFRDDDIIKSSHSIRDLILQKVPIITLDKWNYMTNENLDKVKPESLKSLLIKLKTHISFNQDEINRLVELHKGDKKDIIQFLNRNPILTTSDITDITDITSADIDKCINDINDIIYKELIKSINYSRENSIYHLIYDNADRILHIMQSNFMINHLLLIRQIIDKGKDINENKFDIFKSLSYVDCPGIVDVQSLLFMITFGNFYTDEQVDRYILMKESLNSSPGNKKFPVHHFMMGKGKSSVITPLIAINSYISGKKTFIIVPTHLLEQTKETFGVITEMYSLDNLSIITDYEAKLQLLQEGYDHNNIFIMDEIDMMIDPRTSNFQLVDSATEIKMTDGMINDILTVLMTLVKINEDGVEIVDIKDRKLSFLEHELLSVLRMESIININYGMSKKYSLKRLAIPYMRKDTPLENSEFSSQIVTFVMTFLYFFKEGVKFDSSDFKLIYTHKSKLIIKLLDISLLKEDIPELFIEKATQYYKLKPFEDKVTFVMEYLKKNVFPNISMPADKKTCSFVDIMGLDSLWWGIGYSGTVDVDFPELYYGHKGFDREVIVDADEHISMDMIFSGAHENTRNCTFGSIKDEDDILRLIDTYKYDALIDLGGFFKDYENYEIVKRISNIAGYQGKIFVYLDNNDKKKIYDGDRVYSYSGQEFESGHVFYFYSQKNTVGVDFRQPSKMKCLLAINISATMSQVAQAAWRARKLIQGHTIDMVINTEIKTGEELQNLLKHNSIVYRNHQKTLLDYQTLKWIFRRYNSEENKYLEEKIQQKYLFSEKMDKEYIIKLIKLYVAHNNPKIWKHVTSNPLYINLLSTTNVDNIILGTSSSQHTETTQQEEQQQQKSTVAISALGYQNIKDVYPGLTWFFIPTDNPTDNLDDEIAEFTKELDSFKSENVTLLVSSHSFYLDSDFLETCNIVLVELTELKFLLVNLKNDKSYFYYDKFPMYDVYGNLINKHALHNMHIRQECDDAGGGCKEEPRGFSEKIVLPEILTVFDKCVPDNIDLLKSRISKEFYNYICWSVYRYKFEILYSVFPITYIYNKYIDTMTEFLTDTTNKCNTQIKDGITRLEELYIKAAQYNKDKTPLGRYGEAELDDLLEMYEYPS